MLLGLGLKTHQIKTNKITKKMVKANTERKITTSNNTKTKDKMATNKTSRTETSKSIRKRERTNKMITSIETQLFRNLKVEVVLLIRMSIRQLYLRRQWSLFQDNKIM